MNTLKTMMIAFLITPVLFSCSKSSSSNNSNNSTSNSMSAKVNGASWTASTIVFTADATQQRSQITGSFINNGTATAIALSLASVSPQVGTYNIDVNNTDNAVLYTNGAASYFSETGVITISSVTNGVLSGSFSGNCIDFSTMQSVSITNGSFNCKMQ